MENQLKQKAAAEKKYKACLKLLKQYYVKKRNAITAHFNELIFTKNLPYEKELSIIDFNIKKTLEKQKKQSFSSFRSETNEQLHQNDRKKSTNLYQPVKRNLSTQPSNRRHDLKNFL